MSDQAPQPNLYIIAGPNGAGKTTFATNFLPDLVECGEFLNADMIAAELAPGEPDSQLIRASELMVERMNSLIAEKKSFAIETTLAGRSYSQLIPRWQAIGYRIWLFFLWLPSADFAKERVAIRVREGGHNIPPAIVTRRYHRGVRNLTDLYMGLLSDVYIYDSSQLPPILVWQRSNNVDVIVDVNRWEQLNFER